MSTDTIIPLPVVSVVWTQLIVNSIAAGIAVVFVALRLYSHSESRIYESPTNHSDTLGRSLGAGFGWDDGWILVAVVFSLALYGEQVTLRDMGEGYDFDPNSPVFPALVNNVPIIFKVLFSFGIIYLLALASVKMSVLSFYQRTFSTESMQRAIWATMGVVFIWAFSHTLAFIFVCRPTQAWWDTSAGTCGNLIPIYASIVVVNIITDLIVMALPMYTIWHLQMRKTEKLALTIAFGLGFASIIVACKRLSAVFGYDATTNPTGTVGESAFLCVLETFLALLCVNIPMMRPLIRRWRRNQSTSRLDGSEGPRSYFSKNSRRGANGNLSGNHILSGGRSKIGATGDGPHDEWDMVEYSNDGVDSTSVDDSGSEKRLTWPEASLYPKGNWSASVRTLNVPDNDKP
ncbi:hypothetical protein M434DRAFT_29741 [Hypoxylon sp. CO27-5]|nr:hypothetical protein M434DRAFT_29741 [Hypoxylon sp. CO27-5]